MTRHLKMLPWDYTWEKQPVNLPNKSQNLTQEAREGNAAWSLALEGAAGEVILRKNKCLADMEEMLVHLYGTVQLPRKKYLMV